MKALSYYRSEWDVPKLYGEQYAALYAAALIIINWHWSRQTTSPSYSTSINIDGAGIAVLISAVLLYFIGTRLYRLVRRFLDEQIRIPSDIELFSWRPVFCLLPLFLQVNSSLSESGAGTSLTKTYGYGTGSPWIVFIVATVFCVTLQVYLTLKEYADHGRGAEMAVTI